MVKPLMLFLESKLLVLEFTSREISIYQSLRLVGYRAVSS